MYDKKASAENMAARIVNSLEGLERLIKQRTEIDFYIKPEAVIAVLPAGGGSEIVMFSKDVYTVTSQPETVMKRLHDYKESWSHLNDKEIENE